MPIYEYECEQQHRWALMRSVERRHESTVCPECRGAGQLVPSIPLDPWIQGVSNIHTGWSEHIQDPLFEPDGEI